MDVLKANTDPLGFFKEMKLFKIVEADDFAYLYKTVLIITPVRPYFLRFLEE